MTSKTIKVLAFKYIGSMGGGLRFLEVAAMPKSTILLGDAIDFTQWKAIGVYSLPEAFLEQLNPSKSQVSSVDGKKATVRKWSAYGFE